MGLLTTQPLTWATSLLTTAMVPRYLGDKGFGELAVIATITSLAGTVASLGLHDLVKRRIATQPTRATADVSAALLLLTATAAVLAAGLLVVMSLLAVPDTYRIALALALCGMVLQTVQGLLMAVLVGQERHAQFAWLNAGSVVLTALVGVGVLVAGGGIVEYLATSTAVTALVTAVLWRSVGVRVVRLASLETIRELVVGGLPFLGWNVARLIRAQIDVILVGILLQQEAAGALAAAYRIIGVIVFIPTAITTPLLPVLSREAGNRASFERILRRCVTTVLTLTIPAAGMIIALAPVIPEVLQWPQGFHRSIPLMMILAIQQPLIALDMVLGTALVAVRRERAWLRVMVIAAAFNPAFNLIFIPLFGHLFQHGAVGAAVVEVATELLMLCGALILLPCGLIDLRTTGQCLRTVLAGAFMTLVAALLREAGLPAALVGGGLAFVASAFVLGVLRPTDVTILRRTALESFARRSPA